MMTKLKLNIIGFQLFIATLVGYIPSHWFRRVFYRYALRMKIGTGTSIHWQARFFEPSGIQIGNDCVIGNNNFLDGRRGIVMGDRVVTSAEVMILTLHHDIDSPDFRTVGGPVVLGDYVFVGARAIILPNVQIGEGAVIAAGAVVTDDVPPYTVVGGVPARFLRIRNKNLDYRPNFSMPFQ